MAQTNSSKTVFLTGGTGYIGSRLIRRLLGRGFRVIAFVRPGSEGKAPPGAEIAVGDPFDPESMLPHIPNGAIFVQLLGVPRPSPRKRDLFYKIDLQSVKASVEAAARAGVAHFIYVSVAHEPSKIMEDYQRVRAFGEQYIVEKKLPHTFLRPLVRRRAGPLVAAAVVAPVQNIGAHSGNAPKSRSAGFGQPAANVECAGQNRRTTGRGGYYTKCQGDPGVLMHIFTGKIEGVTLEQPRKIDL